MKIVWPAFSRGSRLSFIARDFVHICSDFDFRELPLTNAHAVMAGSFRQAHRDPFDRVLAAQSIIEDFLLVTDDREMEAMGARALWRVS